MLRKRNLVSLLMAALLTLGSISVAFADDSGADRLTDAPGTVTAIERDAAN